MEDMTLRIPADKNWTLVLSMAAHGAGALCELPIDVLDDIRTAMDEACDLLLQYTDSGDALVLHCTKIPCGMEAELSAEWTHEAAAPCVCQDADIARGILSTLCAQVCFCGSKHGIGRVTMKFAREV